MFYNRDYVCNRRYKVDEERKLMTIVSESVEHPSCPEKPPVHRVKEYWSHIVIKSKEDFDKVFSFQKLEIIFYITHILLNNFSLVMF